MSPNTVISVERTGSAMDEAMIQKNTAADAARRTRRNNNAMRKEGYDLWMKLATEAG
jgi:hypothetical protein